MINKQDFIDEMDLQQDADGHWSVAGIVWGDVRCVEGYVRRVQGGAGRVEGGVRCVAGDVENVEGDVRCVEGNVGCVEGNVRCVKGDVGDVEGGVKWVERDVGGVGGVVSVSSSVGYVRGDVLYNVYGSVKGKISGRQWKYAEESSHE